MLLSDEMLPSFLLQYLSYRVGQSPYSVSRPKILEDWVKLGVVSFIFNSIGGTHRYVMNARNSALSFLCIYLSFRASFKIRDGEARYTACLCDICSVYGERTGINLYIVCMCEYAHLARATVF